MPTVKKASSPKSSLPAPFGDKKLLKKVVPIFNAMHDTALTEKEALSLLDLIWRYANEKAGAEAATKKAEPKIIVAQAGFTVVQEIRRYYDQRPFILDFDGTDIKITEKMSIIDAMRAGINATLSHVEIEPAEPQTPEVVPEVKEPVKRRKKVIQVQATSPAPVEPPKPEPEPIPQPEPEDEDDDTEAAVSLQTYGVNPGEPLSRAVARVWPLRPALLSYNGKTIPITVDMSLIDAQCEAADLAGVDGNHVEEETAGPTISQSGHLYGGSRPYEVAEFDHPIPVDDSAWNISLDRNSGAPFIRTQRAVWLPDYPYRISCVPFDECMNTETMFYVHCKDRPSQAMFDVYHRLFLGHTHKVHVRRATGADGSKIITHEYCSWRPKEGFNEQSGHIVTTVMEALGMNSRWQPGARYRIRYWDTNIQQVNHRYYAEKPKDEALTVLRHPKLKPVIQTRPVGV
ncbi:hypothetical protein NAD41_002377 [Salmonella enterica]|nr:hypothetical protein [Salmonella enterica]EKK6596345.1 hypothetical protein [Salmonella enterica]